MQRQKKKGKENEMEIGRERGKGERVIKRWPKRKKHIDR